MTDFYTADFHLDHANILKHCKRPFGNVREMQGTIIKNWNSVVTEKDTVYILGDLWLTNSSASNKLQKILNTLKGTKHLILGNHDEMKPFTYLKFGLTSVHTSLVYRGDHFLCHDPAWSNLVPDDWFVIHGHIHNLYKFHKNCINVGVDQWNFTPVSYDQLFKEYWAWRGSENTLEEQK